MRLPNPTAMCEKPLTRCRSSITWAHVASREDARLCVDDEAAASECWSWAERIGDRAQRDCRPLPMRHGFGSHSLGQRERRDERKRRELTVGVNKIRNLKKIIEAVGRINPKGGLLQDDFDAKCDRPNNPSRVIHHLWGIMNASPEAFLLGLSGLEYFYDSLL